MGRRSITEPQRPGWESVFLNSSPLSGYNVLVPPRAPPILQMRKLRSKGERDFAQGLGRALQLLILAEHPSVHCPFPPCSSQALAGPQPSPAYWITQGSALPMPSPSQARLTRLSLLQESHPALTERTVGDTRTQEGRGSGSGVSNSDFQHWG